MALEQSDNAEARTFVPSGLSERGASLSRSIQVYFQPIDRAIANSQDLPWALDFGTGADLYHSDVYTGGRLSASALMTDDVEQKLNAPKIQPPSDTVARPTVIRTKEDEAIWDKMQEPHKLGKHESATHIGLSPEVIAEMQKKGQASKLEFFDSTAEPAPERVLIASNTIQNVRNLEQKQPYQNVQNNNEEPKIAQYSDNYMPPPTLVPSLEQVGLKPVIDIATESAALKLEQQWNPYRGEINAEMKKIPESAWHKAYEAFPQFKKAGISEKQAIEVMQAVVRNELYNYDLPDQVDDEQTQKNGKPLDLPKRPANDATLGHSQLSINAVLKRAEEYPEQIGKFKGHEVEALLDPKNAPLLVAATLVHNLEMYKRHDVPVTQQSLMHSYNPSDGHILPFPEDLKSEHVRNVMRQLSIIRGEVKPKPGER